MISSTLTETQRGKKERQAAKKQQQINAHRCRIENTFSRVISQSPTCPGYFFLPFHPSFSFDDWGDDEARFASFHFAFFLVYRNSVFPSGATLREEVKRRSSGTKRAVERASLTKLRGDLNPGAEIQRALTAPHPRLLFRIPRLLFDARYPFFSSTRAVSNSNVCNTRALLLVHTRQGALAGTE